MAKAEWLKEDKEHDCQVAVKANDEELKAEELQPQKQNRELFISFQDADAFTLQAKEDGFELRNQQQWMDEKCDQVADMLTPALKAEVDLFFTDVKKDARGAAIK